MISKDTILLGHGLENDLRALRIVHENVIDTADMFPHHLGLPYRYSLKLLASKYLKSFIQSSAHDSKQDAYTCLELVAHKLLV
ncbi:RNA exonuclease 3 [Zancudomyces culisetae]|uniref:RNA exonuclease 3 n=1 Tax=Zancudomyces culisetae TaxID=1213189 RepID=A0A1R1PXT7_ZANCU|nr:RNA exonuclease 3 [Zancudomyces culisetae]|eukprot:OMH85773.1 RNA exonuclease 3 [Zancudomyces culisetae]